MHADRVRGEPAYFPSLTGLRGVAAGWVMVLHLWMLGGGPQVQPFGIRLTPLFYGGGLGVDLFFVLSGFLLGLPFLAWAQGRRPFPNLARFWKRRCLRVLPAYWIQLLLLIGAGWIASHHSPVTGWQFLAYLSMEFVFVPGISPLLNGVWWSLPVEWNFYLILPLLGLGFQRLRGIAMLVLGLAAAVALRFYCYGLLLDGRMEGLFSYPTIIQLPGRIDQFVFGMAGAWLHLRGGVPPRWRTAALLGGIVGLCLFLWMPDQRGDIFGEADVPWIFWHASVIGAIWGLVVYGAAGEGRLARILLASRAMAFLGTVSYGLYLWHAIVFNVAYRAGLMQWKPATSLPLLALMLVPVALLVAWISFRLTERPFLVTEPAAHQPSVVA